MSKLVLLRHGESEWNRQKRFTGWMVLGMRRTIEARILSIRCVKLVRERIVSPVKCSVGRYAKLQFLLAHGFSQLGYYIPARSHLR